MGVIRKRVNTGMSLGGQGASVVSAKETRMGRKALGKGGAIYPVGMALHGPGGVRALVHRLGVAANGVVRLGARDIIECIVLNAPRADKRTATRTIPDISLGGIEEMARATMRRPFEFGTAAQVTPGGGQGKGRGGRRRQRRGRRGRGRRGSSTLAGWWGRETGTAQSAGTSAAEKNLRLGGQRKVAGAANRGGGRIEVAGAGGRRAVTQRTNWGALAGVAELGVPDGATGKKARKRDGGETTQRAGSIPRRERGGPGMQPGRT